MEDEESGRQPPYRRLGCLDLLARPRQAMRAVLGSPVAVRFTGKGPPNVTRWTYDRGRHGDVVHVEFVSPAQMLRFASRWREVADAVHTSGREDASFRCRGVRIDLGDGVGPECPPDVFAFARRPGARAGLIPNPYMLRPRRLPPALPWERKSDTLYFRGTSTGATDYEQNSRVALCRIAATLPRTDCRISRTRQVDAAFAARLAQDGLLGGKQSPARLNRHRFLVDVDGNSSSWDRYLLIARCAGVPVRFETSWQECWHHLLVEGENCIQTDRHALGAVLAGLRSAPDRARSIAAAAARLAADGLARPALRRLLREAIGG